MGRPATYNPETIIPKVCEGLRRGRPLVDICNDPGMPSASTVFAWEVRDPRIAEDIARARAHGFDAIAQAVRRTARGYGPELGGESTGDVKRDRLIVDTDLKLLAKWDPKRYGEGFQLRMADADGNKLDTSPKFLEALAILKLAGAPAREAQEVQVTDVTPLPAPADISDLV